MSEVIDAVSYEHENDAIRTLVQELELHDPGERGHSERVAVYSTAVGDRLGMPFEELLSLRRAAALHDVGKISVNPVTLRKIGELDESEIQELRSHALLAMDYVGSFEWLRPAIPMIRHHHEWWDGTGYPDGLAGDAIPLGARIISACEAFDVLVSGSPWRKALADSDAVAELRRCSGTQFDPAVVAAFEEIQPLIQPAKLR